MPDRDKSDKKAAKKASKKIRETVPTNLTDPVAMGVIENDVRYDAGMDTRRAVLGGDYVDDRQKSVTPFNADFQRFITQSCWNDVWNRPGLDRRTRSVVVLSITIALRHWGEFRIHVRGALNNGLTKDEIGEILLQSAIYAGVPAANHAFGEAQTVFKELDM